MRKWSVSSFIPRMGTMRYLLTFASYFLLKHPECQEKLLKEAENLCVDPSKLMTEGPNRMDKYD